MWRSNDRNKSWGLVNWKNEPNEKVKYLVRTYPRAVSGDPIAHFFDVHTAKFTLKFKTRAGLNEKTEIFVPKIPSYRITDVAEAIGPSCEKPVVGIRPGEKIHEEMITASDSFTTIDLGAYYAILPSDGRLQQQYQEAGISTTSVPNGFAYNSGSNPDFLSVEQLRALIREHVDSTFEPV